jgi:hypothetical protein
MFDMKALVGNNIDDLIWQQDCRKTSVRRPWKAVLRSLIAGWTLQSGPACRHDEMLRVRNGLGHGGRTFLVKSHEQLHSG